MNVHPCRIMRQAEERALDSGAFDSDELMDCAIRQAAGALARDPFFSRASERFSAVIVYAGKGKNAGDAIGLAWQLGFPVVTLRCACSVREMAPETRRRLDAIPSDSLCFACEPITLPDCGDALIIDGLLGSGASGPLRAPYDALVQEMNTLRASHPRCATLAVDVPTGLDADAGMLQGASAVEADATLAIGCVKPGLLADGAEDYTGRLICVPLPQEVTEQLPPCDKIALDEGIISRLPRRPYSCFKNRAGRVRIIAGSPGYTGAAQLCAEAALAAGAGLVELYSLPSAYPILAARVAPEVMVRRVESYSEMPTDGASALLIGPGLGTPDAQNLPTLRSLVEQPPCPLVLDADGLNLAAAHGWGISPRAILTPHLGEMRRLFPAAVGMRRAECAAEFVKKHPCTLALKSARTIITDGSITCYNTTGGPYMANGGQGDVLSGVIAALAAQGLPPLQAAALGAWLCGRAADCAHAAMGRPLAVRASQLLPHLFGNVPCGNP